MPQGLLGGRTARRGFALVVVLASLVILTLLLSLSSKTLLTEHQVARTTLDLQTREALTVEAVHYVMSLSLGGATPLDMTLPGAEDVWLDLVDVGGLIDLQTADSRLSSKVIEALALGPDASRLFRNWLRQSASAHTLSDVLRELQAGPDKSAQLAAVATLRSGRPGIHPQAAPLPVLELATDEVGARGRLEAAVPPGFTSQPTGRFFQLWIKRGENRWLAGVVELSANRQKAAWVWAP